MAKEKECSVNPFALFETKVLNACSASRTNAQLYYNHSDCKVTLSSATWESFVFFSEESPRLYNNIASWNYFECCQCRLANTWFVFFSALRSINNIKCSNDQNVKNVLDMIIEKDWSGVFIQALPKKSRKEAMRELIRRNLKETWCKTWPLSHSTKAVVAPCPEGQHLNSQVRKLLTSCELKKVFW